MTNVPAVFHARKNGHGWKARCPAHDDQRASSSIGLGDDGRWLLKCHAGCALETILAKVGLEPRDLFRKRDTTKTRIVATYDYVDETGTLLYQACRLHPKDFFQRRPDGHGGWIRNLNGTRRVLYRLRELAGKEAVAIVEGEKDADRLWSLGDLPATTNAGGAGKWHDDYTQELVAAQIQRVVIVPDNDDPGRQHAETIARACHAAGLQVKVLELPGLLPKGDISDWLDAGHTKDELVALAKATSLWSPPLHAVPNAPADASTLNLDLAGLLDWLVTFIRRFVVVTDDQATAIALWIAHTYVILAAECTPYLQVTSATAEAGKTRLLEVLRLLVRKPWFTGRVSAAVLVRKVDAEHPTLLLDESDAAFNGEKEYAEALRGILNTGYQRNGTSSLCVGQGGNLTYKDFSTFCPKAIAGIGKLPDTVVSRAIRIELRRRTKAEPVEKFRERDARLQADPTKATLMDWAHDQTIAGLQAARPSMPAALRDRAEDVLEPLLAIADLAGGDWPERARGAAVALMGSTSDQDINIELLHDIYTVFDAATFLKSNDLVKKLDELDDRAVG